MLTRAILLVIVLAGFGQTEHEHKVHNIILYPEKHSWCQLTPIQQVVASPGYQPVTIDNNICVGACFSYSIPGTQPAEPGELIGPYCDSCQPAESKCYHVNLRADGRNSDGPRTFQKRVQIIKRCSCRSCEKYQKEDCVVSEQHTEELPSELFSNDTNDNFKSEEVPSLLLLKPEMNTNRVHFDLEPAAAPSSGDTQLNSKLSQLLKSIQNEEDEESNISFDKNQLKDILRIMKGSDAELNDKTLVDFLNFVHNHNTDEGEMDVERLKELVASFQKTKSLLDMHRDFGMGLGQMNNAAIEKDLTKYQVPLTFGLEGSPSGHKGGHIGMGIQANSIGATDQIKIKHLDPVVVGRHHLGDEVHVGLNLGHLVKGPHGSLVVSPDLKVEQKLDLDMENFKPNHDGMVIAYENPDTKKKHKVGKSLD